VEEEDEEEEGAEEEEGEEDDDDEEEEELFMLGIGKKCSFKAFRIFLPQLGPVVIHSISRRVTILRR
jgi:hypothetical protein